MNLTVNILLFAPENKQSYGGINPHLFEKIITLTIESDDDLLALLFKAIHERRITVPELDDTVAIRWIDVDTKMLRCCGCVKSITDEEYLGWLIKNDWQPDTEAFEHYKITLPKP